MHLSCVSLLGMYVWYLCTHACVLGIGRAANEAEYQLKVKQAQERWRCSALFPALRVTATRAKRRGEGEHPAGCWQITAWTRAGCGCTW